MVVTKVFITHPNQANRAVGLVLVKRLVTHTCTGRTSACKRGTIVADVFKLVSQLGVCVKCNYDVFPHIKAIKANANHQWSFVNNCLLKAIDANGKIKVAFRCSGGDKTYSVGTVAGF